MSLLHSPLTSQYCNIPRTVFVFCFVLFFDKEREREKDKDSTTNFVFVIYKNDITEGLKA